MSLERQWLTGHWIFTSHDMYSGLKMEFEFCLF